MNTAIHDQERQPASEAVARIVQAGIDAFFAAIARETGAATGDLSPEDYVAFEAAALDAATAWMAANL